MYKVIYLTGAPGAGKSTAARWLAQNASDVDVFQYGVELTKLVGESNPTNLSHEMIREKSSTVVSKEHVRELDKRLIEYVNNARHTKHIIVDSHAVTKESYGFRITPFSATQIAAIAPAEIWVLFANANEIIRRIKSAPDGRPVPTQREAEANTQLQNSVAATYGILCSAPVYLFDSSRDQPSLCNMLLRRLLR